VVVGGTHAAGVYRAATAGGKMATHLAIHDFGEREIEGTANRIRQICRNMEERREEYIVVYIVLEHGIYRDEEGTPAHRSSGGLMHLRGNVNIASRKDIEAVMRKISPLFTAAANSPKAIVGPLPQYYGHPCCGTGSHCTNTEREDFGFLLRVELSRAHREIRTILNNNSLRRFRLLNLTANILEVGRDLALAGPTQLTKGAYEMVLNNIMAEAPTIIAKRKGEGLLERGLTREEAAARRPDRSQSF